MFTTMYVANSIVIFVIWTNYKIVNNMKAKDSQLF